MLAYGNLLAAPGTGAPAPEFRRSPGERLAGDTDLLALQLAFDVLGLPDFRSGPLSSRPRARASG